MLYLRINQVPIQQEDVCEEFRGLLPSEEMLISSNFDEARNAYRALGMEYVPQTIRLCECPYLRYFAAAFESCHPVKRLDGCFLIHFIS
jgi:hypothetical protein